MAACERCGALCIAPDAVMPSHERSANGTVWPRRALVALGLENLPAAADIAAELVALEAQAEHAATLDAVFARMRGLLGPRQYGEKAYAAFVHDMRAQVDETRALRLCFAARGRPFSVTLVALMLATMYAMWIGGQSRRVRAHMQVVDALLTAAIGAERATAIEYELLVPLGAWTPGPPDAAAVVAADVLHEGIVTHV
jgi:hypothetical protein